MRIRGGTTAPSKARRSVLSQLVGQLDLKRTSDLGLVVSELVTNSVVHADIGPTQTLTIELIKAQDRLRVSVIDDGSDLEPRLQPFDRETPGGFGLFLVNELCSRWGVARDGTGATCVWCELLVDRSAASTARGPKV